MHSSHHPGRLVTFDRTGLDTQGSPSPAGVPAHPHTLARLRRAATGGGGVPRTEAGDPDPTAPSPMKAYCRVVGTVPVGMVPAVFHSTNHGHRRAEGEDHKARALVDRGPSNCIDPGVGVGRNPFGDRNRNRNRVGVEGTARGRTVDVVPMDLCSGCCYSLCQV